MKPIDMSSAPVKGLFFRYLAPSISATLVTSIYILADTVMIGRSLGAAGIAALNLLLPLFTLYFGTGVLFGVGGSILFSVSKGKGEEKRANSYFTAAAAATAVCSVVHAVAGSLFFEPITQLLGSNEYTKELVSEYGRILVAGAPVFAFSSFLQAFVRNDKAPKTAMAAVISGGISNVILDYILIFMFDMGMKGAVIASLAGTGITITILITHFFRSSNTLKITSGMTPFMVINIATSGLSSFIVEISSGAVIFLFNIQLLRYVGDIGVVVYGIISNSALVVSSVSNGIGQAAQPIISVNYGAGNWERVGKTLHMAEITAAAAGMIFVLAGAVFPREITTCFVEDAKSIMNMSVPAIRLYFISFAAMGLNMLYSTYFQSVMRPAYAMIICLLRGIILNSIMVFLLPMFFGLPGIWISIAAAEFITLLICIWLKHKERVKIIPTTGRNNCGGRCVIKAHVQSDKIINLTTDTKEEAGDTVPLYACVRGMNYHKTFLSEDRLKYPAKRVGERGEGRFERISWEEAIDIISKEWIRIRDSYGPGSRYVNYATGVSALLRGNNLAKRLLALDGGFLDYYNSYSSACVRYTTPYMYGTADSGSSIETWLNSKLIILWGHNPAETKFDAETMYYLKKAKDMGIPVIGVDPRKNDTIIQLDAEWIPIKPSTDAALMDAMAYVMVTEKLYDKDFTDRCCIGFDKEHMPEGIDKSECYFSYLAGEKDGIEKTPAWAESITGVSADTIISLARRYALAKPAALIPGFGPQRHGNGEQGTRGAIMLACLTGNVGVNGGWAAGTGSFSIHNEPEMPKVNNPYPVKIPVFLWTDAILHGTEMTHLDGVTGGRLESNIKMILNLAGNTLINQHSDINRTKEILKDTGKCEFIVCSDLFMTASAKYADILLPGTSMFESENITMPWMSGNFLGFTNKVVEPLYESRFEYDWLKEVAKRIGLYEEFTAGNENVGDWLKFCYNELRKKENELPDYKKFKAAGIYRYKNNPVLTAFEKETANPEKYPFKTDSGKIEIFSERIYKNEYSEHVPAIPCYVPAHEGPDDDAYAKYPLQLIGWHTKRRCHSIHDNNISMHRLDPQCLWMNIEDAQERDIKDGDSAYVWNDRGKIEIKVKITERIIKGTAAISQGAWYKPDENGIDHGGSINVLTSLRPTPLAKGNPQHTNRVEVCKTGK